MRSNGWANECIRKQRRNYPTGCSRPFEITVVLNEETCNQYPNYGSCSLHDHNFGAYDRPQKYFNYLHLSVFPPSCCTGSLDSTSCFLQALGLLPVLSHLALFNLFQKKTSIQKRIGWYAYMAFLYRNRLVPSWQRAPFWKLLQFSQSGNCRRF